MPFRHLVSAFHAGRRLRQARTALNGLLPLVDVVEREFDAENRLWIARNVFYLVVQTPRGEGGLRLLVADQVRYPGERDRIRIACKLASSLLYFDCIAQELCNLGSSRAVAVSFLTTTLQGRLERFMSNNGMPGWGVPFASVAEFEQFRRITLESQGLPLYGSTA